MGRVGGLAVALGVGAAIVSGWSSGLAWADDSPGSAGTPASSDTAGPDVATAKPSASGDEADSSGATTATSTATTGTTSLTRRMERCARRLRESSSVRVVSGRMFGADHQVTASERDGRSIGNGRRRGLAQHARKTEGVRPGRCEAHQDEDSGTVIRRRGRRTRCDAACHRAGRAGDRCRRSARQRSRRSYGADGWRRVAADGLDTVIGGRHAARRQASPPHVVGVVSRVVSGVVNAILRPFAASSTPGAPADAPSMWALLAFARREFESAVRSPSGTPAAR